MNSIEFYEKFCTGCGLCAYDRGSKLEYRDGFKTPILEKTDTEFCSNYCMSSYKPRTCDWKDSIWGNYEKVYYGYSSDEKIRKKASSGGIITSVCIYLIESGIVDGVIHSAQNSKYPWRTETYCSTTAYELKHRSGSRYAQSSPLENALSFIQKEKRYIYVGKPCDVYALHKYLETHPEYREAIYLTISFFCAGAPSENANIKLLNALGCVQDDCASLTYRGNGWPGKAEVITKTGKVSSLDYQQSWGRILGRDIRPICRFCMNGTGEPADISCGDAWYLTNDKKPLFIEADGRNVVFGRSEIGNDILQKAFINGYIILEEDRNIIKDLRFSQPFQYERKATMFQKVLAMRCLMKKAPNDALSELARIKSDIKLSRKFEIFKGTVGRIVRKKI